MRTSPGSSSSIRTEGKREWGCGFGTQSKYIKWKLFNKVWVSEERGRELLRPGSVAGKHWYGTVTGGLGRRGGVLEERGVIGLVCLSLYDIQY